MILDKIQTDLKTALKEGDKLKVSTLRLLVAAIKDKEIKLQKRGTLKDEEVLSVIQKQVKQRKESIEAYQKAERPELADKESQELEFLNNYLPQQKSPEELEKVIDEVIGKIGASGPKDFGKAMGLIMSQLKGQVDGNLISQLVRQKLQ